MRKTEERTLKKLKTEEFLENEIINRMKGITLIALVITIVLNCSYLAMERMLNKENILKI